MKKYSITLNEESHEVNGKVFQWKQYLLGNSEDNSVLHLEIIKESDDREELRKEMVRLNDSLGDKAFTVLEDCNRVCFIAAAKQQEYILELRGTDSNPYKDTNLEFIRPGIEQSFSQCCHEMDGIYPRE